MSLNLATASVASIFIAAILLKHDDSTTTNTAVLRDLLGFSRFVQLVLPFLARVGAFVAWRTSGSLAASCGLDVAAAAKLGASSVADSWAVQFADDAIAVFASLCGNSFETHGEEAS